MTMDGPSGERCEECAGACGGAPRQEAVVRRSQVVSVDLIRDIVFSFGSLERTPELGARKQGRATRHPGKSKGWQGGSRSLCLFLRVCSRSMPTSPSPCVPTVPGTATMIRRWMAMTMPAKEKKAKRGLDGTMDEDSVPNPDGLVAGDDGFESRLNWGMMVEA